MTDDVRDTKTVTVEDIIAAAGKNGFTWTSGSWLNFVEDFDEEEKNPPITGACILGQAMLNLGVEQRSLYKALMSIPALHDDFYDHAAEEIIDYNDSTAKNFDQAFARLKEVLEPHKEEVFDIAVEDWTLTYDVEGSRSTPRDTAGQETVQT